MTTSRRQLAALHRWTGFTLGLFIMVVALTGAAMAMRPQIDPLINAGLLRSASCHAPLPLDTLVANARSAAGGAGAFGVLRLAGVPDATVHVRFSDDRWFYMEPCSGAVLGVEDRYRGVFGTLDFLHRFKYLKNGDLVSGSLACIFVLVLLLGGLALWWPASTRALRHSLTVQHRLRGRAFSLSLHKTVALYASPILLVSALTGVLQAFEWGERSLLVLTASVPAPGPGKSTVVAGVERLSIERHWQTARQMVPNAQATLLQYPKKANEPVRFELIGPDAPHGAARSYLSLDAYSGAVLRFAPYENASRGHKLFLWLIALHTGLLGGLVGQLLLMLGALAVPVLAVAGLSSYLRRRSLPSTLLHRPS
ncbi:MAG: hypothetical protein JWR40_1842 [Massilia sp.]|jgi:uncharacterized iron-regulated membrane protein|nr:hypothetical protein [Massilia sp.]MDB5950422.1 hypothetical protein [Massilia sp.]